MKNKNSDEKETRNAKGQGSFMTLENGKILYRKGVGTTVDGKRKVLVVRANSRAACIKLMKEKEEAWNL